MATRLKVVSGGQTGADRGGLDAAIVCEVPHGGWCPRDRRAEDGRVPRRYELVETPEYDYLARTERNVVDSDGTIILTIGALSGGSRRTAEFAEEHDRPWLHLRLGMMNNEAAAQRVEEFIERHGLETINIAGSRGSKEPELADRTFEVLCRCFRRPETTGR